MPRESCRSGTGRALSFRLHAMILRTHSSDRRLALVDLQRQFQRPQDLNSYKNVRTTHAYHYMHEHVHAVPAHSIPRPA